MQALENNQIVTSPVSGIKYKIGEVLGAGGFGRAYRAWELGRRNQPVDEVCLKTTLDQSSWHRESYFGELLRRSARAIQTLDSFPMVTRGSRGRGGFMYCLVLELADGGTVADYLERTGKAWTPARARREIAALLRVLDELHGASATHRDITPMNIFVCGKGTLKLGDFGIARHELAGKPMTVEAFNPAFVTQGFIAEQHRHWLAVDDVYQMGQLLAMLLRGDAETIVTPAMVGEIACDQELRAIIKRAIGPRRRRYADAYEMLQAVEGNPETSTATLRSLAGKTVVFTGVLSLKRFDAELLALQAGATVVHDVTRTTDVVVQGGRSPRYKGGHKGTKLQQAQALIKKGQKIHVIGEADFRRLTRPKA
ncbi:MAG: protein kinase [Myxococcales bacterium]|nr:protein kinase [Myxococcales bacterium]